MADGGESRPPRRGRVRRSPGGVGDGLPAMPDGEPLLHRWFVLAMLVLSLGAVALTVVLLAQRTAPPTDVFPAAERRPVGSAEVTHERGQLVLAEDTTAEQVVTCAPNVGLVGDEGGRGTLRRAFGALCQLLDDDDDGELALVAAGLEALDTEGGIARVALSQATGVDSSARVEDGRLVVEIAPKFQFDNGRLAAPFLAHELAHLGGTWPGVAVDAEAELAAMRAQHRVCALLGAFTDELPAGANEVPRGCLDADELLAEDDPLAALRDAGYTG